MIRYEGTQACRPTLAAGSHRLEGPPSWELVRETSIGHACFEALRTVAMLERLQSN